jgi:ubiquinone/menaquinone biosynthesis C-methylase UbiE
VSEWERHSAWWVAGFTAGADVEYAEQIVPLIEAGVAGASRVLDVGCGEGQLARTAVAGGAQAVGIDGAWNQLAVARDRGGGPSYARSLATDLPFPDAAFDAAIACLVFEHLDDLTAAAYEIGRVLETGGRLHCVLNHPLTQTPGSGLVEDLICLLYRIRNLIPWLLLFHCRQDKENLGCKGFYRTNQYCVV